MTFAIRIKNFQVELSVSDLNEWIENNPSNQDEDEDEDDNHDVEEVDNEEHLEQKIKHVDAIKSFEICIQWATQNNVDVSALMALKDLQEQAIKKSFSIPKKQTLLNQFFN